MMTHAPGALRPPQVAEIRQTLDATGSNARAEV
jgi:hypothetical protein